MSEMCWGYLRERWARPTKWWGLRLSSPVAITTALEVTW